MKIMNGQDMMRTRRSRQGFTLVECALALVVVAIGIIAAFALISTGLDSSAKAVSETRAALFADDVFNDLRNKSVLAYDSDNATAWETFWENFINPPPEDILTLQKWKVTVAAGEMWQMDERFIWSPTFVGIFTNTLTVSNWPYGNDPAVIAFTNYCARTNGLTEIVNNVLRYNLDITLRTATNPISNAIWTNKVLATLNVWEGEFGATPLNRALTFTTEIPNSGGL